MISVIAWLLIAPTPSHAVGVEPQSRSVRQDCNRVARDRRASCVSEQKQNDGSVVFTDCGPDIPKVTISYGEQAAGREFNLPAHQRCVILKNLRQTLLVHHAIQIRTTITSFGTKIVERLENGRVRDVEIINASGAAYRYGAYADTGKAHDATFEPRLGEKTPITPPSNDRVTQFITGMMDDLRPPPDADAKSEPDVF